MQIYEYFDIHSHSCATDCKIATMQNYRLGVDSACPNGNFISAGFHPYDAAKFDKQLLTNALNNKNIVAIGEIGLDFRDEFFTKKHVQVFEEQLKIAKQFNLPVILHCVKAYPQTIALLEKHNINRAIFHGFNSGEKNAKLILYHNYSLSFGYKLLQSKSLQELFKVTLQCFPNQVFLETDDENFDIRELYSVAAKVGNVELNDLKKTIYTNFTSYFKI